MFDLQNERAGKNKMIAAKKMAGEHLLFYSSTRNYFTADGLWFLFSREGAVGWRRGRPAWWMGRCTGTYELRKYRCLNHQPLWIQAFKACSTSMMHVARQICWPNSTKLTELLSTSCEGAWAGGGSGVRGGGDLIPGHGPQAQRAGRVHARRKAFLVIVQYYGVIFPGCFQEF